MKNLCLMCIVPLTATMSVTMCICMYRLLYSMVARKIIQNVAKNRESERYTNNGINIGRLLDSDKGKLISPSALRFASTTVVLLL